MSFHPSNPEANKRLSPDGFDTNQQMGLALPLAPPSTTASILLRDQETNQTLQHGFKPAHTETSFSAVDNASDPILLQDMAPWSPTTSSLAASEIRTQGNPTPTSFPVPVMYSEARPALFAGSAPHLCFGSSSLTNPNQGVALANSLNRLHLHTGQLIAHCLNQEHLRIRTPPHDLSSSPLPSQGQAPIVRSQALRFSSPVVTTPRGTSPVSVPLVPVPRSQREPWMSWNDTQPVSTHEAWFSEVHSPLTLSAALAAILTAAPTQRPIPVARDIFQSRSNGASPFSGPGGPRSSSPRSSSRELAKGMKVGASDGPLYDEGRDIQWDNDFRPIEFPATLNVDIDFDDYIHADDDEDEDEDEDDSYEADTSERENDSGCDIGGDSDQDGHAQHADLDDDDDDDDDDEEEEDSDDASQMSAVAWGKRRAVSPSFCSSTNNGNQCAELPSLSFPCSSPTSPSSPKVNKDRQSKQDCSDRDSGLFPFTCPICSKRFQKLLDLNRHCERHLPRPVQCLNCSRKLSRGDAMKRHALSVRFRACLDFGWFAERDYMLGNFPDAPSPSSSSSRARLRPRSRSMALQEEDAFSTAASEDTYITTSAGSSTSESSSSAEEANLSLPEQYPDDGSPVVYGEPGNWSTIRNGVRKQIQVGGPFRVRACFLEWYLPRSPRVSRPPSTSPDPPMPQPRKRANKKQKGKVDKKKRREHQE